MSGRNEPKELDRVLNECVERMVKGASVQDCLEAYPDRAEELRSLLLTAARLQGSLGTRPTQQGREAGRRRLLEAIASGVERRRRAFPGVSRPWRAAGVALSGILVLFLSGAGVVWASSDSLPDETLYPVKRTVERVRYSWPLQSDDARAQYSADLAARRGGELVEMARRHKERHLEPLSQRIERNLERTTEISVGNAGEVLPPASGPAGGEPSPQEEARYREVLARRQRLQYIRQRLDRDYEATMAHLRDVEAYTSPEFQPRVRFAMERVTEHYDRALRRMDALLDGAPPGAGPRFRRFPGERRGDDLRPGPAPAPSPWQPAR